MSVLFALWCGVLWRVRGGAWETLLGLPATGIGARIAVAVLMAAPIAVGLGSFAALALAPALFLGMVLAGWGDAMDIGRTGGSRWGDAVAMSGWGVVVVLPSAVVIGCLGGSAWPLIVAGMLFGPIYALAWHLARLPNPLDLPKLPNIPGFAWGATEWAEFAAGCAIGVGLLQALPR